MFDLDFVISTLDDEELFTQEKYFSVTELLDISLFLNQLAFLLIMEGLSFDSSLSELYVDCHSLLMLLYSRDARRSFTEPNHWLIKYVGLIFDVLLLSCVFLTI